MRTCAVLIGAVTTLAVQPMASPVTGDRVDAADTTLARARQYVAQFESTFSAVMWRERYVQEDHVLRMPRAFGAPFERLAGRRETESDILLLWIPRDTNWIAVRDVLTVDGAPPPGHARSLDATLARPDISVEDLRTLAAENARFNIGRIVHTFSEPTLALLFLSEWDRGRFAFKRRGDTRIDARRTVVYDFSERSRPTIVRDEGRDIPARGSIWIDPETGQILQTFLELNDRHTRVKGSLTVRYGPYAGFDVLVPLEMREKYTAEAGEEVRTVATYGNFRKFQTAARIIHK